MILYRVVYRQSINHEGGVSWIAGYILFLVVNSFTALVAELYCLWAIPDLDLNVSERTDQRAET